METPVICFKGERLALGPLRRDLAPLLLRCAHNGVAVECVTFPAAGASVPAQRQPS